MIKMEIAVHSADELQLLTHFLASLSELRRKEEAMMPKVLGGVITTPGMQDAGNQIYRAINPINQTTMTGTGPRR